VRVRAGAEHLGVAVLEVAVALAELGDLGRADEREVHRPEEHDLPLARIRRIRDLLELLALVAADRGLQAERGERVADREHPWGLSLFSV
jgi:hypothetical protein